jgi:hypothetical protein
VCVCIWHPAILLRTLCTSQLQSCRAVSLQAPLTKVRRDRTASSYGHTPSSSTDEITNEFTVGHICSVMSTKRSRNNSHFVAFSEEHSRSSVTANCKLGPHWRMVSFGMLRRVALVRTDVSEELSASFIRLTRIGELGTTLAVTSNRRTLRRNTKSPWRWRR